MNEDTKRANDSIMTAAESVEKQNQLIDDTRDKFNDVGNACLLYTSAAVIVISVVAYLGKRTTRTCAVIMTLSMMIGYFVIVQLNTTVGTWTYGLPLLIVAMVYLDKKIVMVTNGIALVSIVVHLVRCFLGDGSDLQNNVIGLFVLLLTAYACNSAEHLLCLLYTSRCV